MSSVKTRILCAAAIMAMSASQASAETLRQALAAAYNNNPTLNAARAELRAVDENVSQALSGYRPTVTGNASATRQWTETTGLSSPNRYGATTTTNLNMQVQQILFRGMRTKNGVKQAEASIKAAREGLKNTEQTVLFNVATVYMDVLRDQAILELRKQNVEFLQEQVRSTRDRLAVGETIGIDVAQSEARLAGAISAVNFAKANLTASRANYQLQVGKKPGVLKQGFAVDKLFPRKLSSAIDLGMNQHPQVVAAQHNIDAAQMAVKVAEGELMPTVSVTGQAGRSWTSSTQRSTNSAQITGNISVPLYQGGRVSSKVRQAKETLGQRRIQLDLARDTVRANVISAWSILEASIPQITSAQSQVQASKLAMSGVIEENKVGQRTMLDVLNSQTELVDARIALVNAQHDRIVASYRIASSVGKLNASALKLNVAHYNPKKHYNKVRDKWYGLRTPDGR